MNSFLSSFFGRRASAASQAAVPPDLSSFAHVAIDVQDEFCNPARYGGNADTDRAARTIAAIAPAFRRTNLNTIWIYFDSGGGDPATSCGGFYRAAPGTGDDILPKKTKSAFQDAALDFDGILRARGIGTLILSGMNFSGCVRLTALDALARGYKVWLMLDATADDNHNLGSAPASMDQYRRKGALLTDSAEISRWLRDASHQPRQHLYENRVPFRPLPD